MHYGGFLLDLIQGDRGTSYRFSRPALDVVLERVPATLLLTTTSLGLGLLVGVPQCPPVGLPVPPGPQGPPAPPPV